MISRYDPSSIREIVSSQQERLLVPWMEGRPATYACDQATKDLISLGYWLEQELQRIGCNDADRKTQCWKYNRLSRSYDVWHVAAECLNDVVDGTVEQNRKPHRRWG